MNFRTQLAAGAAVALLMGLAACGGDDDDAATSDNSTDTTGSTSSGAGSTPEATHSGAGHSTGSSMITMKDNSFSPASLTVAPGDTIMVMNAGNARHDLQDDATKGKAFDSGDIEGGQEGTITAPDKAGEYPYVCTYHFGMNGTLTVK